MNLFEIIVTVLHPVIPNGGLVSCVEGTRQWALDVSDYDKPVEILPLVSSGQNGETQNR